VSKVENSSDESFYVEKNQTKEIITVKNETVFKNGQQYKSNEAQIIPLVRHPIPPKKNVENGEEGPNKVQKPPRRSSSRPSRTTEEEVIGKEIERALERGRERAQRRSEIELESSASSTSAFSELHVINHHHNGLETSDTESCMSPNELELGSVSMRTTAESESTKSFVGYVRPPQQSQPNGNGNVRRAESFQHGLALPKPNGSHKNGFWPKLLSLGEVSIPTSPNDYDSYLNNLMYDPNQQKPRKNKSVARKSSNNSSKNGTGISPAPRRHESMMDKRPANGVNRASSQSNLLDSRNDEWTIKWRYPKVPPRQVDQSTFVVNKEKTKRNGESKANGFSNHVIVGPPNFPANDDGSTTYRIMAHNKLNGISNNGINNKKSSRINSNLAKSYDGNLDSFVPYDRSFDNSPKQNGPTPHWLPRRFDTPMNDSMRTFDIPTPDYSTMSSIRTVIHHEGRSRVLDMPAGLY
jgi:hypothetical protein